MTLDPKSQRHLGELLEKALESFDGLCARWEELQPQRQFSIRNSEEFRLGYLFGSIEENFTAWFYSNFGRSMTDQEYKSFWLVCRKQIRKMH